MHNGWRDFLPSSHGYRARRWRATTVAMVNPRVKAVVVAINRAIVVAVTAAEVVVIRGRLPRQATSSIIDPRVEAVEVAVA